MTQQADDVGHIHGDGRRAAAADQLREGAGRTQHAPHAPRHRGKGRCRQAGWLEIRKY